MTLRSSFRPQQLLFLGLAWIALAAGSHAQDVLILTNDTQIQGQVLGVSGSTVQVKDARGTVGRPLSQIKEVRMAVIPAQFAVAQKALAEKQTDLAIQALEALKHFRGLPAEWAQRATAMVGDAYVEKGDIDKAEAAYKEFQRLYPNVVASQSDIGLARVAVAKKDLDTAKQKIEPVTSKALEEKTPAPALQYAYSQAFLVLGQIKEGEGDFTAALENYLRTVTVFPQDRAAVATAQEKADALRKAHPEVFVP
jgi:tetratricopeptide (TPR) repeat protein